MLHQITWNVTDNTLKQHLTNYKNTSCIYDLLLSPVFESGKAALQCRPSRLNDAG